MIVVADTSPLNYLILLDKSEILPKSVWRLELGADLLLIDERLGRQAAEARNLQVAGTLALLLRAGLLGLIDFPVVLDIQRLGFRVSQSIEARMLATYQQQRKP